MKDKPKKKIEINKMDYTELINLLVNNQGEEIKAGMLFIVLREFHKHLVKVYDLKEKPNILIPDNSIKDLKGNKI